MANRRKAPRRVPVAERTPYERAAISICRSVYHGECACERAPSVCVPMVLAARQAICAADSEFAETLAERERQKSKTKS